MRLSRDSLSEGTIASPETYWDWVFDLIVNYAAANALPRHELGILLK